MVLLFFDECGFQGVAVWMGLFLNFMHLCFQMVQNGFRRAFGEIKVQFCIKADWRMIFIFYGAGFKIKVHVSNNGMICFLHSIVLLSIYFKILYKKELERWFPFQLGRFSYSARKRFRHTELHLLLQYGPDVLHRIRYRNYCLPAWSFHRFHIPKDLQAVALILAGSLQVGSLPALLVQALEPGLALQLQLLVQALPYN